MSKRYYVVAYLNDGFASAILASGEHLVPVFSDGRLAVRYSELLLADSQEAAAVLTSDLDKESLKTWLAEPLIKQGISNARFIFPDDDLYEPLLKALGL